MPKWLRWFLLSVGILVVVFSAFQQWKSWKFVNSKDDKFITVSPLDLDQIRGISPFRSCIGHDYSGKNIAGEQEDTRSMKHYIEPLSQFNGTSDKVKLYSPFDGKVARIQGDKDALKNIDPRFGGKGLSIYPFSSSTWTLEFGHIYPLEGIKVGSKLKAGDLIGYAYVQQNGSSSDLALWDDRDFSRGFNGDDNKLTLDSVLNHMTDLVYAEFVKYGITKDNLIISKEYRNAHPCQNQPPVVNQATGQTEINFVQSDDMVPVEH